MEDGKVLPIDKILEAIKDGKKKETIQVSFATKALHTIDNDLPIVDEHVKKFLKFSISGKGEAKIASASQAYSALIDLFNHRDQNGLSELVQVFDEMYPVKKFPCVKDFTDAKKIDFIMWGKGKVDKDEKKKKKANKE